MIGGPALLSFTSAPGDCGVKIRSWAVMAGEPDIYPEWVKQCEEAQEKGGWVGCAWNPVASVWFLCPGFVYLTSTYSRAGPSVGQSPGPR